MGPGPVFLGHAPMGPLKKFWVWLLWQLVSDRWLLGFGVWNLLVAIVYGLWGREPWPALINGACAVYCFAMIRGK
jgi:hypothetical protein